VSKIGYKLFRIRKDGSLGPLFINARQRISVGDTLVAESHRTKGFAYRPGWHVCSKPVAPHLSKRGRKWFKVRMNGNVKEYIRPASQGGLWFTAEIITVLKGRV
jgi:hypothetical protein